MVGVTNAGAGTSGVPVRFNTRGEVLALTLRRPAAGPGRVVAGDAVPKPLG